MIRAGKPCPKCHGSVFLEVDIYGRFEKCLQCAFTRDLEDKPVAVRSNKEFARSFQGR